MRDHDPRAMIEFDCEGCGVHVLGFGRDTIPLSHMCGLCEWLCEFVPDPEAMMKLRGHMRPEANEREETP